MSNQQILEKEYLEFEQQSKKIQMMKFCIISNSGYLRSRNELLNFAIEYKQ